MTRERGDVVIGTDPFGASGYRPYLVLSNEQHPFAGEEYLTVIITTTERDEAVALTDEPVFVEGELLEPSYANPWNVVTLKEMDITKRVARLQPAVCDEIASDLTTYITADE